MPANPLDLAGKTLMFTPDGRGGYARRLQEVAWEEDIGRPVDDNDEVELSFRFAFSGRTWDSVFVSRRGLVTFGEPYPLTEQGPDRWGTMAAIAEYLGTPPMIAALYKPALAGFYTSDADELGNTQYVSRRPDRVVITWITSDPVFHISGLPPKEKTRFQLALHADGRIAFHYAPEPQDPEEAIRDGVVGLFSAPTKSRLLRSISDAVDGSVMEMVRGAGRVPEVIHEDRDAGGAISPE